jgi:hypothetical protein
MLQVLPRGPGWNAPENPKNSKYMWHIVFPSLKNVQQCNFMGPNKWPPMAHKWGRFPPVWLAGPDWVARRGNAKELKGVNALPWGSHGYWDRRAKCLAPMGRELRGGEERGKSMLVPTQPPLIAHDRMVNNGSFLFSAQGRGKLPATPPGQTTRATGSCYQRLHPTVPNLREPQVSVNIGYIQLFLIL